MGNTFVLSPVHLSYHISLLHPDKCNSGLAGLKSGYICRLGWQNRLRVGRGGGGLVRRERRDRQVGRDQVEVELEVTFKSNCSFIFLLPQFAADGVHLCKMFIIEGAIFGTIKQTKLLYVEFYISYRF